MAWGERVFKGVAGGGGTSDGLAGRGWIRKGGGGGGREGREGRRREGGGGGGGPTF